MYPGLDDFRKMEERGDAWIRVLIKFDPAKAGDVAKERRALAAQIDTAVAKAREETAWLAQVKEQAGTVAPTRVLETRFTWKEGGTYLEFVTFNFGGAWHLSEDTPLIDDLPHYEHTVARGGTKLHLYHILDPTYSVS